jgi:hypothetical protein
MKPEPLKKNEDRLARRQFVKSSVLTASLPFLFGADTFAAIFSPDTNIKNVPAMASDKSLIGGYGQWAVSLQPKVPALSFRNSKWTNQAAWQKEAIAKATELMSSPPKTPAPKVSVEKKYVYDGLEIEEITWQLPYGRPTRAVVLKPQGVTNPLPAILGLHDHAGKKYFGYRKIVKTSDDQHPLLQEHQVTDYGGKAWANEIAKKGYVVLVHDTFAFGSRRVFFEDVKGLDWGGVNTEGKSDSDPEKTENIETYNTWSSEHEHVMSKSLFSAGTTWPGVFCPKIRRRLTF